jgi:hypothetical protein
MPTLHLMTIAWACQEHAIDGARRLRCNSGESAVARTSMPVYCVFERSGSEQTMFNLAAADADDARRLVALNCHVRAQDQEIYGCELDETASVPWGEIHAIDGRVIRVINV